MLSPVVVCELNNYVLGLSCPRSLCKNTRHCTGVAAAMPWVIPLMVLK